MTKSIGRMPPALPKLKGPLAKAIVEIAAIEKLGFFDTADAAARRSKLKLSAKDARTLLESIGDDVGVVPEPIKYKDAGSLAAYEKLEKVRSRIDTASFERKNTLDGLRALADPAAAAKKAKASKPKKKKKLVMKKPPLDKAKLRRKKGREELLDAIGAWIVEALDGANDDDARAAIAGAICAFSDVREAAGQERGEYAGHFFMVDAVGLDDTDRPVPWNVLRERVGDARIDALNVIFDEVLPEVP
jgi:hypothetical protein